MSGRFDPRLEAEYAAYLEVGSRRPSPARASGTLRTRRRQDDPPHLKAIWSELLMRPARGNEAGIQARKYMLGYLFSIQSPAQAAQLYERLRIRRRNDELSRAFHHALATPTRQRLLTILQLRRAGRPVTLDQMERILWPRRARREFEAGRLDELEAAAYPDPRIQGICRHAGQLALRLRQAMRRAGMQPNLLRRRYTVTRIRRRGATWINRISGQFLPILDRFDPRDLDRLVGCLARVEHAIGRETGPLRRLKAAARQRLTAP